MSTSRSPGFLSCLVCALLLPVDSAAQRPVIGVETDIEGKAQQVYIGGGIGVVSPHGEALEFLRDGRRAHVFVGVSFDTTHEVRIDYASDVLADALSDESTRLRTLAVEVYRKVITSPVELHVGPRIAWVQQSRRFYGENLNTVGCGATASAGIPVQRRLRLQADVGVTAFTFDRPPSQEVDGLTSGWLPSLSIGAAFDLR